MSWPSLRIDVRRMPLDPLEHGAVGEAAQDGMGCGVSASLVELYRRIPRMLCIEGCTDCCGPVPFSRSEWEQVADKREGKMLSCPYSGGGYCDIYAQRPFICRLFGTVPGLACPHGCRPIVMLTDAEEKELMDAYLTIMQEEQKGAKP